MDDRFRVPVAEQGHGSRDAATRLILDARSAEQHPRVGGILQATGSIETNGASGELAKYLVAYFVNVGIAARAL